MCRWELRKMCCVWIWCSFQPTKWPQNLQGHIQTHSHKLGPEEKVRFRWMQTWGTNFHRSIWTSGTSAVLWELLDCHPAKHMVGKLKKQGYKHKQLQPSSQEFWNFIPHPTLWQLHSVPMRRGIWGIWVISKLHWNKTGLVN